MGFLADFLSSGAGDAATSAVSDAAPAVFNAAADSQLANASLGLGASFDPVSAAVASGLSDVGSGMTPDQINAILAGNGGAGTYITLTATASSGTITGATNVQTGWIAASAGLPGELVKIIGTAY